MMIYGWSKSDDLSMIGWWFIGLNLMHNRYKMMIYGWYKVEYRYKMGILSYR